jgi:hypothetical protein
MGGGGLEWDQKDNNNKHSHRFAILQYTWMAHLWHLRYLWPAHGPLVPSSSDEHKAAAPLITAPVQQQWQRKQLNNPNPILTDNMECAHTHTEAVGPNVFSFYFLFSLFTCYSLYVLWSSYCFYSFYSPKTHVSHSSPVHAVRLLGCAERSSVP